MPTPLVKPRRLPQSIRTSIWTPPTTFARYARLMPGLAEETLRFMSLCQPESDTAYGCGKTLFGSDANAAKGFRIAENLHPLQQLNLPEEEKAMILGGNALKLLKL